MQEAPGPVTPSGRNGEESSPGQPSVPPVTTMGVDDFMPSKKRDLSGIMYMAATGTQPSGKALPSLLPDRILTMQDHVNFAIYLNPHREMLWKAVPPFARAIAEVLREEPQCVNENA